MSVSAQLRRNVLTQASNVAPDAYKPSQPFSGTTCRLVDDGYLRPAQLGGYYLTADGERELTRLRMAGK